MKHANSLRAPFLQKNSGDFYSENKKKHGKIIFQTFENIPFLSMHNESCCINWFKI